MTSSMIRWHLARDNQVKLAKFCEKNKVMSWAEKYTFNDGEHDYWQNTYKFDNGGYITAEMLHGATKSYSVADHFQVIDYEFGQ